MKMMRAQEAQEAQGRKEEIQKRHTKKNGPLCSDPNAWNSDSTHANLRPA
jgi:hypothetical protein